MTNVGDNLRNGAGGIVLAGVILSPWLFGSADGWAFLLICLIVHCGVILWLFSLLRSAKVQIREPALTVALMAFIPILLIQMAPLPNGLVRTLAPRSAEIRTTQEKLFEQMEANLFLASERRADTTSMTLSACPAATRRSLYLFVAYLSVFVVLANAIRKWRQVRTALLALTISCSIMTVFALIQKMTGTTDIYWVYTPRFGGSIFGPFTNRNHFAEYMNLAFGASLGLFLASNRAREMRKMVSLREKVAWLASNRAGQLILLGYAVALIGCGICLSLSRGGVLSLVISLGVLGTFATFKSRIPSVGRLIVAVAVLSIIAVVWLGGRPVVDRLGTLSGIVEDPLSDTRAVATLDTLRLFASAPLLGTGFGSFQHVFPSFQSPSIQGGRFLHAHNDYAQFLAEGGIASAFLAILCVVLFLRTIWKRFARMPGEGRLLAVGLSVGLGATVVHSFFEFGLHKPAIAFLFSTLCGIFVAILHLGGSRSRHISHGLTLPEIESLPREQEVTSGICPS